MSNPFEGNRPPSTLGGAVKQTAGRLLRFTALIKQAASRLLVRMRTRKFWFDAATDVVRSVVVNVLVLAVGVIATWSILPSYVRSGLLLIVSPNAEERVRLENQFEYFKQTVTNEVRFRERIARREQELGGDVVRALGITLDSGLVPIPDVNIKELNESGRASIRVLFHNEFKGIPAIQLTLKNAATLPPSNVDQLRVGYCIDRSGNPFLFTIKIERLRHNFRIQPGMQVGWVAFYLSPDEKGKGGMGDLGMSNVGDQCK
jgi:hypothetical protein